MGLDKEKEMKVSILNSGVFPILKIENFLPEAEYKEVKKDVKKEVLALEEQLKGMEDQIHSNTQGKNYNRIYLDAKYYEDRAKSKTLMIVQKALFSNNMFDVYNTIPETCYRLIQDSSNHETEITVYKDKSSYNWHTDAVGRRVVNFVLMIDLGMKFEGGHTHISNVEYNTMSERTLFEGGLDIDPDIDVEPKGNQLIIMPMWVTHRVTPIKMKSTKMLDGRITVNGHIGHVPRQADRDAGIRNLYE